MILQWISRMTSWSWKCLSELVFGSFVVDWQSKTGLLSSAPTRKKKQTVRNLLMPQVSLVALHTESALSLE